jgi:hypothetical protein
MMGRNARRLTVSVHVEERGFPMFLKTHRLIVLEWEPIGELGRGRESSYFGSRKAAQRCV